MDFRIFGLIAFILIITLSVLAIVYTDYLWFQELTYESVFLTILSTKLVIFFSVAVFFFIFMFLNIKYATRNIHKSIGESIVFFLILVSLLSGFLTINGWETEGISI